MISRQRFNVTAKALETYTFNVIPDRDPVARIDDPTKNLQRIEVSEELRRMRIVLCTLLVSRFVIDPSVGPHRLTPFLATAYAGPFAKHCTLVVRKRADILSSVNVQLYLATQNRSQYQIQRLLLMKSAVQQG